MSKERLRYDILKELFNISVGKAASMLSEITNKRILLNVPDVEVLNMNAKELKLEDYFPKVLDGTLMVSSISFERKLTGRANLIFPAKKIKALINLCYSQDDDIIGYEMNFTNIDFDIIKEIGNIILNSVVGGICNYLDINLNYTLPEVKVFNKIDFNKDIEDNNYMYTLVLYITFIVDDTEIEGAIIVDLTLNSLNELMKKIDKIEDELYE